MPGKSLATSLKRKRRALNKTKVRGQYLLHALRRRRRAVGSHSLRMVRLLRMSNSTNLSKEGLPHAWPLDKR